MPALARPPFELPLLLLLFPRSVCNQKRACTVPGDSCAAQSQGIRQEGEGSASVRQTCRLGREGKHGAPTGALSQRGEGA